MAAELISPDALKIGVVAMLGLGYAAYKTGLLDKIKAARGVDTPHFRPRPVYSTRTIRFERAVLDVCGIDQLQLIRITARLRRMGFWIIGDFSLPATGLPFGAGQKFFARAFVHGEEPIYAIAVERKGLKVPSPYLDYFTLFTDLTFLTASNSDEDDDARRPGALRFHRLSGLLPEELYQHHRANLEALRNNWMKAVPTSREAFFSHFRQWLVVDSELRRARDQEVRKNQITRTVESLPALDIGPILKRYDGQRTPFEFARKGVSERDPMPSVGSPTVIKDPERAPIRRRLPPIGPAGPGAPGPGLMPAAGAVPLDPTYGDALSSSPGGFTDLAPEPATYYQETGEAHPLDMLDRMDSAMAPMSPMAPPGNVAYEPVEDYGGDLAYEQPDQNYYRTDPQGRYAAQLEPPPPDTYPPADPVYEPEPEQVYLLEPEAPFNQAGMDPPPEFALGQDLGHQSFFAQVDTSEPPAPTFVFDQPSDLDATPLFAFDTPISDPNPGVGTAADPAWTLSETGTAADPAWTLSETGTAADPAWTLSELGTAADPARTLSELGTAADPARTLSDIGTEAGSALDLPDGFGFAPVGQASGPWEGIPTDPPAEIVEPSPEDSSGEGLPQDIRISLRQIQSWRPPDFSEPTAPAPETPGSALESAAARSSNGTPDTPERCPTCRTRTLSRYSQRCHKCRSPLPEALTP